MQISFKERVKNELIACSKLYKSEFVDYEYLVCSDAFTQKDFYIISAGPENFAHLTGVNCLSSPTDFFQKCYDGTLDEADFNFTKKGESEKFVKGCVRSKIIVLRDMVSIFTNAGLVEESFTRNRIACSFATSDNKCTLGFANTSKARPMTLLNGNELNKFKARSIELLMRKHTSKQKFDEIIIGDLKTIITKYYRRIEHLLDEMLIIEFYMDNKHLLGNINDYSPEHIKIIEEISKK